MNDKESRPVLQEPDRLPGWTLALVVLATLLFSAVLVIVNGWTIDGAYASLGRGRGPTPTITSAPSARPERILFVEGSAARALERQQRAKLERFGWVDRNRELIHIPVERAMDLVVREGWR